MSIISFTCDKNYIYVLIYYILEIGEAILEYFEKKSEKDKIYNIIYNISSQYIKIILLILADLFFLPFIIYTKCSFKGNKPERTKSKGEIKLIHYNPFKAKCKNIVLYSILISILDLTSRSVYFLFFLFNIKRDIDIKNLPKRYQMDYVIFIDIISRFLFSRWIIKTKIYKHHKVSILISLIAFILFIFSDCIFVIFNKNNIIYMLIVLLRAILFPLEDTINQILLSKYFLLSHYLLAIRGIIEFTFFSIITIILSELKKELFEKDFFSLYNLIYFISYSIKAFCLMKIIYIFNSQYVSFLIICETIGSKIIMFIDECDWYFILEIISLIIVIFGTLMYNEIIIINLFGLETKTKKYLTLEQNEEGNEQMMSLNLNENNLNMDD